MDHTHSNPRLLQDHCQNSSSPSDNHKVNVCSICRKFVNSVTARKLRCKQNVFSEAIFDFHINCAVPTQGRGEEIKGALPRGVSGFLYLVMSPQLSLSALCITIISASQASSHGTQRKEELFSFLGQFSFLF